MAQLRSSTLWQVFRHRSQPRLDVKEQAPRKPPNNTALPVEILEMIFVHLDMWTLLRCRNVCRFWQDCIPGTSPSLRHTMFLCTPNMNNCLDTFSLDIVSTYLGFTVSFADGFVNTRDPQPATEYTVHPHTKGQSLGVPLHNPLLFFDMSRSQLRRYKAIWTMAGNENHNLPLWMNMYATDPPARRMKMEFFFVDTRVVCEECWVQRHRTDATIVDPRGITVGRVLDAVYEAVWWPDMMLSRNRRGPSVRLMPREEGEKRLSLEADKRLLEVQRDAAMGRAKKSFFDKFEWEE